MRLTNVLKGTGVAVLSLGVLAGCAEDNEGNEDEEISQADMEQYYTEEELTDWARTNGFVSEEDLNAWAEDNGLLDDGDSVGDEKNGDDMAQADENNMDATNNDNSEQS